MEQITNAYFHKNEIIDHMYQIYVCNNVHIDEALQESLDDVIEDLQQWARIYKNDNTEMWEDEE